MHSHCLFPRAGESKTSRQEFKARGERFKRDMRSNIVTNILVHGRAATGSGRSRYNYNI